jgi:cation diffusion facilitator family transporter
MKELLWKTFVKDYENYKDPVVRGRYTRLTGTLGVIVNSVLCVAKIILGCAINSIAVVADGFHDLADSLAACITLIAAHISRKPADKRHPYGHARAEYLASLLVSAIILIVGYQLMRSSIDKCLHPQETHFTWLMVGFMVFAILLKGSQALFTIATGKHISSLPVIAAGTDNRNDVITSIIIVIGMLVNHFTGLDLDGYMGCLVSLFILYSGFHIIMETVGPLLGEPPDRETVEEMRGIIMEHPEVLNTHDLIIYNYGPGRNFASFHVEVDSRSDLLSVHALVDQIERDLKERMNIEAVGHMDPVVVDDPVRIRIGEILGKIIPDMEGVAGCHDVRIVLGKSHVNVIFDVVLRPEAFARKDEIGEKLTEAIRSEGGNYHVIINFDQLFV